MTTLTPTLSIEPKCPHSTTRYLLPVEYYGARWLAECLACGEELVRPENPAEVFGTRKEAE